MARVRPIHHFGRALSLMTAIPIRQGIWEGPAPQVSAWFPMVGVVFGAVGYAIVKGAALLGIQTRAPYVVAALVVIVWALLSRLLHWDGLADVADGYWGALDKERRLEIMSDSQTGAFGVTAIVLVALLEVLSMGLILGHPHEFVILLVPILPRFSATAAAWFGTPARPGGLGKAVMGLPGPLSVVVALLPVAVAVAALWRGYPPGGLIVGVVVLLVALSVPAVLARRFGGVTGDVMGASVLITEVAFLVAFALAMALE
jgi:adenosylcobinamide-GDP ribazoletransferase